METASQIVHPAEKIIMMEEQWPNDACAYVGNPSVDEDDVLTPRHVKKGNIVWADGHVTQMLPNDLGFDTLRYLTNGGNPPINPINRKRYCNLRYNF
jgi:prepilin-type processing-associated H-X9-DG protein